MPSGASCGSGNPTHHTIQMIQPDQSGKIGTIGTPKIRSKP
jgi:hypothetical protein